MIAYKGYSEGNERQEMLKKAQVKDFISIFFSRAINYHMDSQGSCSLPEVQKQAVDPVPVKPAAIRHIGSI